LNVKFGLCHGSMGTVVDIVYPFDPSFIKEKSSTSPDFYLLKEKLTVPVTRAKESKFH